MFTNSIYSCLGGLDDVNCYRTVERYDPQSDEWTEVASLKSPRGGVGVATLGKYLYAAGGNDGSASLQTVERYELISCDNHVMVT